MTRRVLTSPRHLADALDRQSRCALESAQTGHWQPQTLGDCAAALRQASAMINALMQLHPHFPDEATIIQDVQPKFWENLASEQS